MRDDRPRPAQAIVVLGGGGVWPGNVLSGISLRRTTAGILLYHRGLAPLLLLSGVRAREQRAEGVVRAELARAFGVPADAIAIPPPGVTTRDEIAKIATVLHARGITSVLLVSDGLHLRRAAPLLERAGVNVVAVAANDGRQPAGGPGNRLRLAYRVLREAAAIAYYRLSELR